LAALRNADALWASATYTLAIIMISAALVGALARSGKARLPWAGFAVFGWACLITEWSHFGTSPGVEGRPALLGIWLFFVLENWFEPPALGGAQHASRQVADSFGIMLFGLVGAVLSRLVAAKDDRADP